MIAFGLIAFFPMAVLIVLQISALRYQSEGVNWAQRAALAIDLFMLVWFYRRQHLAGIKGGPRFGLSWFLLWSRLLWAPAILIAANLAWLNIPEAEDINVRRSCFDRWSDLLTDFNSRDLLQPLDLVCRSPFQWGCRFLTVDHQILSMSASHSRGLSRA